MFSRVRQLALGLLLVLPLSALAMPAAQQVVQQTTDTLLADLKANKAQYKADPAAFYASLERILGPVVDVQGIARGVMTVRYSRRASAEQLQRFEEEFKRSLMQFYGNALLEYDNQDIRVLPVANAQDAQRSTVNMEIRDARGTVYPLSYTMVRLDEQWKLRNMVINGINVGKLFRDQFAQSMQSNRNDLDKTIAGWAELVARSRQGEQAAAQ
ncbi:MAG: ABC transporter substrate-binding protein [Pseudomonas sp.]|jgi:phospholipid transport system substrate-binding protein|nr:ABC transporter substrate-binding protein [Pseudomonas sp.]